MKVLAVNTGSSTLKWKLYEMPAEKVIAEGMVDRMGLSDSIFTVKYNGEKTQQIGDIPNANIAVAKLMNTLTEQKIIQSFHEIAGIGHRIVAGGEVFRDSTLMTKDNIAKVRQLSDFAPLHNPVEAGGIEAFAQILPDTPQVGVFDTSFHASMPMENFLYSIPIDYYRKYGARKYGAHGTSHRYVSARAAQMLGVPLSSLKMITLHMGSGVSLTAIKGGKSIDTSMGFTPLAGVTMSTRSGDIDASLVAYLMDKMKITNPEDMINILNTKSGILGLSELSPDMRDLEKTIHTRPESKLAIDVFVNRIVKYIGSYIAIMGGLDAMVFTAGIGEGDIVMRERIAKHFDYLGLKVDPERNNIRSQDRIISTDDSKVKVLLVPTNEELMIARDTVRVAHLAE
ncbi:acetate/propionate family kinase [Schleiferilactobacillus perolens]|nr:acetate kinase [Schleiferilactobacillus perolens]MCI1891224.1 acetate kinase [Schleiferilactobacillus harbinensis]MCI1911838.1 acetate kinase [Schleiferilactobacillus harbinensis]MCI2171609.1 acetate kinase [Schleiferilactobacillus perolens]